MQPYQDALDRAGYDEKLAYSEPNEPPRQRRRRKRKCIWWNPPYSMAVQTNLTKMFYSIINRAIPKNHEFLPKLFNKNNLKISYSCTKNMGDIIGSHNTALEFCVRLTKELETTDNATVELRLTVPLVDNVLLHHWSTKGRSLPMIQMRRGSI